MRTRSGRTAVSIRAFAMSDRGIRHADAKRRVTVEFAASRSGDQMNIHEYQAKAVLKEFGVPVRSGVAC